MASLTFVVRLEIRITRPIRHGLEAVRYIAILHARFQGCTRSHVSSITLHRRLRHGEQESRSCQSEEQGSSTGGNHATEHQEKIRNHFGEGERWYDDQEQRERERPNDRLILELNDFKTRRVQMFRKNLIELTELQVKHAKVDHPSGHNDRTRCTDLFLVSRLVFK